MPARSNDCRKCDSLLVGYCDRELDARLREWVDEHVVACKRCGIALSRIELETLRLREALVPMEPSVHFTDTVMDRVREEIALDATVDAPASMRGRGFTSRVLDRVRGDLQGESDFEDAIDSPGLAPRRGLGPQRFVRRARTRVLAGALAAAVLFVALLLPYFFSKEVAPLTSGASWVVVEASGIFGAAGEADPQVGLPQMGSTLTLPFTGELRNGRIVLENASRTLASDDGSSGAVDRPGWRIGFEGSGRFTVLSHDRIALDQGELVAWSEARSASTLAVDLPGATQVELAAGRYEVSVEGVEGRELSFATARLDRITVRVLEGSAGLRTGGLEVPLASGTLALLEPLRPLVIHELPSADALALVVEPELRNGPSTAPAARADFVVRGFVRGAPRGTQGALGVSQGEVVAGAAVTVHAGSKSAVALTSDDGSYEVSLPLGDASADEVWLSVAAPATRGDLAAVPFRKLRDVPLSKSVPGAWVREDVSLATLGQRSGRLVGADGAALVGARVRALRIDSFVGAARLLDGEAVSDDAGRFVVDGLTPERAGETTAWVIEPVAAGLPPHVEYGVLDAFGMGSGVADRGAAPLVIHVDDGVLVELPIQDPATRVLWVEKRPVGVASQFVARVERIDLPAAGRSAVHVRLVPGSDLCWWEDGGSGSPQRAHIGSPRPSTKGSLALLAAPPEPWKAGAALMSASFLAAEQAGLRFFGTVTAFDRDAPRPASSRAADDGVSAKLELRVFGADSVAPVESASIYVRVGAGLSWFAGWTDLDGRIVVRDLPQGAAVQVLAMLGDQEVAVGGGRYVVDEASVAHHVALQPLRRITTQAPPTLGSSLARIGVLDGSFEGFETNVRVGPDGIVRAEDLPPGTLRIEIDGRMVVVGADGSLPDIDAWRSTTSSDGR
ncbi:MAG TPA: hypothetical protein PKE00_01745 [Planctomycetota bacterium]|nr:hypothetical protein [Planctomycetota bacterium]